MQKITFGGYFMEFYELCRQIRDTYRGEPNREIELQILSQLHTAFFENGDKLPGDVTLQLNIKSILKNPAKIKYWAKTKEGIEFPNARVRNLYFFETIVIDDMLTLVLDDLNLPKWNIKNFIQRSAWNFSIQIAFSKSCMKSDIDYSEVSEETKEYWKAIL